MFGYTPYLRITPPAGPAVVYTLASLTHMTVAFPFWEPLFLQKETVNRRLINVPLGWRPRVQFAFTVEAGSASETTLVTIGLSVNRADATLEVSMDGGTLYRDVVLASWSVTRPADKNIGAVYEMEFVGDPVDADSMPPEPRTGPPAIAGWA